MKTTAETRTEKKYTLQQKAAWGVLGGAALTGVLYTAYAAGVIYGTEADADRASANARSALQAQDYRAAAEFRADASQIRNAESEHLQAPALWLGEKALDGAEWFGDHVELGAIGLLTAQNTANVGVAVYGLYRRREDEAVSAEQAVREPSHSV